MTVNRRELLAGLGVGSAAMLLACGAPARVVRTAPQVSSDVRSWLRDAVARLAAAFPQVHAMAVSRRQTSAAIDILGIGVGRDRCEGCVLSVRDKDGVWHEQVTAELTQQGVQAAVRALAPNVLRSGEVTFPSAPPPPTPPSVIADDALKNRVGAIMRNDKTGSSRIVYAAAMIEIDDVTVWSIAPGMDLEHQARRVRKTATRAAWNGTRPAIAEVARGWVGDVDDQQLTEDDVTGAATAAMALMTPGAFADGVAPVVLDPGVTASIVDAAVRGLLTAGAARRPEVAARLAAGASIGAGALTLVDDPLAPGAYGGFPFDDEGTPAAAITLLDQGQVAATLGAGRMRRPGHVGALAAGPSHLRLMPGLAARADLIGEGWLLEGEVETVLDPASDRITVAVARARELKGGSATGRVYADVELVANLGELLAGVDGVTADGQVQVFRDVIAGEPLWRSIEAPWVRSRGMVRARRRTW